MTTINTHHSIGALRVKCITPTLQDSLIEGYVTTANGHVEGGKQENMVKVVTVFLRGREVERKRESFNLKLKIPLHIIA